MTISLAWTRKVGTIEELLIASDSRLSFGCRWDCCPKIVSLPRGDAFICFAGNTMYAYPIMFQAIAAISQHPKLQSRGMDITHVKGHLIRILNSMVSQIHDLPKGIENDPDTTFLVGGWSWKSNQFKIWLLHFDPQVKKFTYRPTSRWAGLNKDKIFAFTGDYSVEYKKRLIALLRGKGCLESGGFDMEPLEVLRDMLRDPTFDQIGGAPQVMKVYKYSSTKPYAVFWPNKSASTVSLHGRPLLDYEKSEYFVLDVDTMEAVRHADLA